MSHTVQTVNCPTCHNAFPKGRGAISVCPRCGERVLVPTLDDAEQAALTPPASEIASIPVECSLCSSRFYARPSQLGQKMKCPDCHTENVVVEATSRAPKKTLPKLSELTDEDDFKLSDPVETPRYQALTRDALQFERALRSQEGLDVKPLDVESKPVHRPPAESRPAPPLPSVEDDLIDLGPEPETPRPPSPPPQPTSTVPAVEDDLIEMGPLTQVPPTVPLETKPIVPQTPASPDDIELFPEDRTSPAPPPKPAPQAQAKRQAEEVVDLEDEDEQSHVEVRIAPPEKRVEYKPVITLPKPDAPEDKDDGSEVDFQKLKRQLGGLMQGGSVALPPELARRKPFSPQTLLFFLQPAIIGRFIALTGLVLGEIYAMSQVPQLLQSGNAAGVLAGFFIYLMAFLPGVFCFLLTAMFCFTIVQDTANGQDKIESWPELSIFSWFEAAIFFGAAFFLAGLPGALLGGALSGLGVSFWISYWISPLILLMSLVVLFPPILISMLEAGSVMEPISVAMLRSFSPLLKFWLQLYGWSLAIGFFGLVVFNVTFTWAWLMLPGAALLTALPFIYFRLLGRMAMMYRDYIAAITPDEEEPGPVVRHVIQ